MQRVQSRQYGPDILQQCRHNDGPQPRRHFRTPGNVGSLGLLYQWGRKDPFLGAGSYSSSSEKAASTGVWPEAVASDVVTGTIDCTLRNPMTFVTYSGGGSDWYYLEGKNGENTRFMILVLPDGEFPMAAARPESGPRPLAVRMVSLEAVVLSRILLLIVE